LQFSLQAASPETFRYTLVYGGINPVFVGDAEGDHDEPPSVQPITRPVFEPCNFGIDTACHYTISSV